MKRPQPRNEEIILNKERYIVSRTDTKGIITYCNDYFMEISGYKKEELLGQPHNIIRHPDMPRIIFKIMWERIEKGHNIMAVVKNLAKDGRYYWVVTDFESKFDPLTNEVISHVAFRRAAPRKAIEKIIPVYKTLIELEQVGGMDSSRKYLENFLLEKNTSYDEIIRNLVERRGLLRQFLNNTKKLFS